MISTTLSSSEKNSIKFFNVLPAFDRSFILMVMVVIAFELCHKVKDFFDLKMLIKFDCFLYVVLKHKVDYYKLMTFFC